MFFSKGSGKQEKRQTGFINAFAAHVASLFELADEALPATWCSVNDRTLVVTLPFACETQHSVIEQLALSLAEEHQFDLENVTLTTVISSYQSAQQPVTNVRNIIAISSGKGGVGKSATAVNVAYGLMQEGAKVGILDADIYGPSLPTMLGTKNEHPQSPDNKVMIPIEKAGIVSNSIGYLVSDDDAAVWRGPMASRALMQLLNETRWPVLDYLIVDMPPGTGDVQLTMAQQAPLTAAVVVTTPQDLALADAQKGIAMFEKVSIPVLGLVENMSSYACSNCGHVEYIFSHNGGSQLCERYDLPLLGSLPLSLSIREYADAGTPLLVHSSESILANQYREIARSLSLRLALTGTVKENAHNHIKGDPIIFNQVDS